MREFLYKIGRCFRWFFTWPREQRDDGLVTLTPNNQFNAGNLDNENPFINQNPNQMFNTMISNQVLDEQYRIIKPENNILPANQEIIIKNGKSASVTKVHNLIEFCSGSVNTPDKAKTRCMTCNSFDDFEIHCSTCGASLCRLCHKAIPIRDIIMVFCPTHLIAFMSSFNEWELGSMPTPMNLESLLKSKESKQRILYEQTGNKHIPEPQNSNE